MKRDSIFPSKYLKGSDLNGKTVTLTIDRIEAGRPCRLDTKRKILIALGLQVSDREKIFGSMLPVFSGLSASGEAERA